MLGISSACLYPMETEQALAVLSANGVRDIEIFFNARCETEGQLFQQVRDVVRAGELRVHAVHPYFTYAESYLLFSNYERRFADGVELYQRLAQACQALSCDLLVLHGEREPFHSTEAQYMDRYDRLEKAVAANGVRLTQENVVHFRSQDTAFLERMRDAFGDRFRMTFDVKQAVRCGVDPLALAEQFASSIVHVHLSDHSAQGDCLLPCSGDFDFAKLFSILNNADYAGDYVIELYRGAYGTVEDLMDGYKKLQKIAKK